MKSLMVMMMTKVNWSVVRWVASLPGKVKGCLHDSEETGTHARDSHHDDDDDEDHLKFKMVIMISAIII